MTLTFGSLFAGIGAIDLGLERCGMQCKWQVEIDKHATNVLNKNFPNVAKYSDARMFPPRSESPWLNFGARQFSVDGICGGFPCQPHSVGGLRKGAADERDMWGEYARIIREIKPKFILGENVRGILSTESGRFFGGILRDLARLGYDAEWITIPAEDFGTPHLRERVFIVAYASGTRRERLIPDVSALIGTKTPFAVNGHRSAGAWMEMVRNRIPVRSLDGLTVAMERRRIKQCGNSVVPQVVEYIGHRIVEHFESIKTT